MFPAPYKRFSKPEIEEQRPALNETWLNTDICIGRAASKGTEAEIPPNRYSETEFPTLEQILTLFRTKTTHLMAYREIIAIQCKSHTTDKLNKICGEKIEIPKLRNSVPYRNHGAVSG
jgi:hypothetical protein